MIKIHCAQSLLFFAWNVEMKTEKKYKLKTEFAIFTFEEHFPRADSFLHANVYILFSAVIKRKHWNSFAILIIFHRLFNLFIIVPKSIWAPSYVPASTVDGTEASLIVWRFIWCHEIYFHLFIYFLWEWKNLSIKPLGWKHSFVKENRWQRSQAICQTLGLKNVKQFEIPCLIILIPRFCLFRRHQSASEINFHPHKTARLHIQF